MSYRIGSVLLFEWYLPDNGSMMLMKRYFRYHSKIILYSSEDKVSYCAVHHILDFS